MNFMVHGHRVHKSTGETDQAAAEKVVQKVKSQLELELVLQEQPTDNYPAVEKRMPLSEAFRRCYQERWKYNKQGLRTYRTHCPPMIELLNDMPIEEITNDDVVGLINRLEERGLKRGSVNRYLAALSVTLNMALKRWGKLSRLPYIGKLKETSGRIRTVSYEEEACLLKTLRDLEEFDIADLVVLLVDTGMRRGEALGIHYSDVDFTTGLIHCWINKSDKPKSVPMSDRVRAILERRKVNGAKPFSINPNRLENVWARARRKMGLQDDPQFVVHALRHTCATRLLQNGVDIYTVQKYLGHSTIQVTERYAHMQPSILSEAVRTLERARREHEGKSEDGRGPKRDRRPTKTVVARSNKH